MKLIIIFFLTINLLSHEKEFESKFGFLLTGTLLSNFKDARVAVKSWLEDVALDYNSSMDIEFYEKVDLLYDDLKKGKLDMIVINLPFFFKNKDDIVKNADNFWSLAVDNSKYVQYYLISQKVNKSNSFKDIDNKIISMRKNDDVARIWLDKSSLIEKQKSYKKVIKKEKIERKESTVLLNVFFKKSDYAIITKRVWETMIELNPAILNKLKIVKKSEKIHLPFIGVFKKGTKKKVLDLFFKLSNDLSQLKGSEQIIDLLKFDYIFKLNDDSLEVLEKYYLEYFELEKKYK